ncbi:hypothetical protein BDV29DRAFT_156483 [Aspergillus leporis]|uniref:Alcohol dehydrogenase-like C-terminal domain-containing protein n=1 Tax=Aspergillus leporis TaxID=41062 RepID=A0A5N5X1W3_9EURO|nr:hypothetical protein BDV29DRAFT_156483 [Aspergillus leporis]
MAKLKITEERWCFAVPPDLSDEQAAMAYINPLTACMMVHEYGPSSHTALLAVNGATSAIGQMIIHPLNRAGVRPIAQVRRADAQEELSHLDFSAVLCTSEGGLQHKLLELTGGRGLAVVWDKVGGSEGDDLFRALSPGGTLVHYGLLFPISAGRTGGPC